MIVNLRTYLMIGSKLGGFKIKLALALYNRF